MEFLGLSPCLYISTVGCTQIIEAAGCVTTESYRDRFSLVGDNKPQEQRFYSLPKLSCGCFPTPKAPQELSQAIGVNLLTGIEDSETNG